MKARRIAILGASESGKSFLASGIIRGQWRFERRRSCIFDPWKGKKKHPWSQPTDWGAGAWVNNGFERWKRAALNTEGLCVGWDEATTNGGRDRDNVGMFTEIRHNHPVLIVMGHRYEALLPTMRICLTDLITARCMPQDADKMAGEYMDAEIKRACDLEQYEFLWKQPFQPVRIVKFTPEQIAYGIRI